MTEHGRVVLRVCRALLPLHDAEDAAADAFLAALEAYPRLPAGQRRQGVAGDDRAPQGPGHPAPPGPARGAGAELPERRRRRRARAARRAALAAVRALPDKQRHAVAYHYVADLAYAEVAAIMGTSEAAARRSAADGIKALRRTYSQVRLRGPSPSRRMTQ